MIGRAPNRIRGKAAFALPFFLSLAGAPTLVAAREERLPHFTPWHVIWTPKTCKMQRGFGDEKNFVILQIERFAPGDGFQMVVTGKRLEYLMQGARLEVSYGSDLRGQPVLFQMGKTGEGIASVFFSSSLALPADKDEQRVPVTPQREAAATSINLAWSGRRLVLETGPLAAAFGALRKCTDDLVRTWGLDPAVQLSLSRLPDPRTHPSTWLRPADYPTGALMSGKQAIVNFRLSVDAAGVPTACDVQLSYSGEAFDKHTCDLLMARARFEPARDTKGLPVASYYVNTVKWYLP